VVCSTASFLACWLIGAALGLGVWSYGCMDGWLVSLKIEARVVTVMNLDRLLDSVSKPIAGYSDRWGSGH
jgi:hypothetical protein